MARTVRREPIYVPIPKVKDGFFVHKEFNGICDTKNDVNVDQRTFSDAKNVYIDERGLLTSRLPLRITDHTQQWIVNEWMFGNIGFRLHRVIENDYFNFWLRCYTHPTKEVKEVGQLDSIIWKCKVDDLGYDFLPKIALVEAEDKIFVWFGGISFYCFNTTDFYFEDAKKYIYIPIHKLITNGLEGEAESKNFLTDTYIKRYEYSALSSVSFNDLIGKELTVILESDNKEKKLYTITVDENEAIALIYPYSYIGEEYYVDMVQTSRAMVIMRFHKTLKTIDISFDGRMFKSLPLLKSIVGRPYLTRDGMGIFAFTTASLAKCKLVAQESDDFIEDGILVWEMEEYCKKSETTVDAIDDAFNPVGYFENMYTYAYIIESMPHKNNPILYAEWLYKGSEVYFYGLINRGHLPTGNEKKLWFTPESKDQFLVVLLTRIVVVGIAELFVTPLKYNDGVFESNGPITKEIPQGLLSIEDADFYVSNDDIGIVGKSIYYKDDRYFTTEYNWATNTLSNFQIEIIGTTAKMFKIFPGSELVLTNKYIWKDKKSIDIFGIETMLEKEKIKVFSVFEDLLYYSEKEALLYKYNGFWEVADSEYYSNTDIYVAGYTSGETNYYLSISKYHNQVYKSYWSEEPPGPGHHIGTSTQISDVKLNAVTYGDSKTIAVGDNGIIYQVFPNAVKNEIHTIQGNIYDIAYGYDTLAAGNIWVAVGESGIYTTSDPMGEWTKNTYYDRPFYSVKNMSMIEWGIVGNKEVLLGSNPTGNTFLRTAFTQQTYNLAPYSDGMVWLLATDDGIYHYDILSDKWQRNIDLSFTKINVTPLHIDNNSVSLLADGTLWTSSLNLEARLYLDELVGDKSMTSAVPDQSVMFQSHMLSYDKTLQIASPARDDNYNFMWYLPKLNERKLNRRITALHPLSQEELGIFTEDGLWYQSAQIQFAPIKSKLPIICKDGNEVATALNGSLILFATPRGITALAPQFDVATTEQTLTYLSDTIQGIYEEFYNEPVPDINKLTNNTYMEYHRPMIRLATYKYWVFFYKFLSREILVFDTRNGSYWRWETQYPVKKITVGDTLSFLLQVDFDPLQVPGKEGTKLGMPFELKEFEEYSDEVIEDSINGDSEYIPNERLRLFDKASSTIDWLISSQPLHFAEINNFKTIKALNLSVRGDYIQPMQLRLKAYREVYHPENTAIFDYKVVDNKTPESTTVFDYRVTELRTYVQRMNIMRACNFQYTLSLDPEAEVQTPIQLNSISVKYEVKEKVR